MAKGKTQLPQPGLPQPRLSVFVSSVVTGYADLLDSIYALLTQQGFEVCMSHKGTVLVDSNEQAYTSCLKQVEQCDLFLGVILPGYGSGKSEDQPLNITHREMLHAIELNMPRWFLVHEHVVVAAKLLSQFRDPAVVDRFTLKAELGTYRPNEYLGDLRVVDMYNAAIRRGVDPVSARTGNWVQTFGEKAEAQLFVEAQFRRHRELFAKLRELGPPSVPGRNPAPELP